MKPELKKSLKDIIEEMTSGKEMLDMRDFMFIMSVVKKAMSEYVREQDINTILHSLIDGVFDGMSKEELEQREKECRNMYQ